MAMPAVAGLSVAEADQVRVRVRANGNVKVRKHVHRHRVHGPRAHVRVRTPRRRYRLRIGGSVWLGGGIYVRRYAAPPPPPPPPDCDCYHDPVPAYYTPAPAPPATVHVAAQTRTRRPLPRFGIGLFAGGVAVEDAAAGHDLGIYARLRLSRSGALLLEAELAKTELDSGDRVDRRAGGALVWDILPRGTLSPYLLVGGGVQKVDMGGGEFSEPQGYGEAGVGLTWKLTRRFHLGADIRAGLRTRVDEDATRVMKTSVAPPTDEEETFTRARLSAMINF